MCFDGAVGAARGFGGQYVVAGAPVLSVTALCFSLQTLLLIVDKTGGGVVVNNLGDVGVEGCVGGVGTANGAQRSELCC